MLYAECGVSIRETMAATSDMMACEASESTSTSLFSPTIHHHMQRSSFPVQANSARIRDPASKASVRSNVRKLAGSGPSVEHGGLSNLPLESRNPPGIPFRQLRSQRHGISERIVITEGHDDRRGDYVKSPAACSKNICLGDRAASPGCSSHDRVLRDVVQRILF